MAEGYVGLPSDGAGKKLRSVTHTEGADTVHQEVVTLAKSDGSLLDSGFVVTLNGLPTTVLSQVAVGTSQVAIPTSNLASRKTISIKALAANGAAVYIGLTGVTTSTGFELSAGDSIDMDADATVDLFAISASGTQRVSIAEVA